MAVFQCLTLFKRNTVLYTKTNISLCQKKKKKKSREERN